MEGQAANVRALTYTTMAVAVTVWGVPRDGLPTIEPTSLYVLALLQLAQKQAVVLTPPTLIHTEACLLYTSPSPRD